VTAQAIEIHGTVHPDFEEVREAFAHNFEAHGERGAAVAVRVDGEPVVDLWAGHADPEGDRPWERDTIVNVYSTTKGMTAICAHILADRGELDLDAPVVEYWPEFGAHGKQEIPVRWLLTHQAGLVAVDPELGPGDALDWDTMISALEQTAPQWEPGTKNGYHMVTFGWLVGEVVRRVSGAPSLGAFFRSEVAEPLGVDFFIGTPASEDGRIASIIPVPQPPSPEDLPEELRGFLDNELRARSLIPGSREVAGHVNSREWRAAEIPGANGHGNARALATVYGALANGGEVDGHRLLSPEAIDRAREVQVESADEVLVMRTARSLGFMHPMPDLGDLRGRQAFGHGGAGGSSGWADPEHGIGMGYVMNKMWDGGFMQPDPRAQSLGHAVYNSLGISVEARRGE
jgi:CubicO group peptidase (beta-lactamase class C family)